MIKDKYEYLYSGFCAEYHFISNIYRLGLEANKMVVDFGFDVIVTNQFKRMKSKFTEEQFSKLIQVKSRWFPEWEKESNGDYKLSDIKYGIKKEDLYNLLNEPNSLLACYVCLVHEGEFYIPCGVYFNNKNLRELLLEDYITFDKHADNFNISLSIYAQNAFNKFNSFMETKLEPCIHELTGNLDLAGKVRDNIEEQWRRENSFLEEYPFNFKLSQQPSILTITLNHLNIESKNLDLPISMYDIKYILQSNSDTEILTSSLFSNEADWSSGVQSFGMEHDIETTDWKNILEEKMK